jgi:hypothetical protein
MTPQGQVGAPPPQQPGWFSRNWKWVVLLGCVLPTTCCLTSAVLVLALGGEELESAIKLAGDLPAARVDCGTPGPGGVDCDVKRTKGAAGFTACWDLEITCQNQGVMSGHACGTAKAGQDALVVNMPVSGFSNQEGCDAPVQGNVVNLTVEVAP